MDSSIKLLANVIKTLLIVGVLSFPVYAKQKPVKSQNSILATSYFVKNLDTGEIVAEKNPSEVRSIASITKLMTSVVVLDAHQDMNERIRIEKPKGITSKLPNGIVLTRSEIMLLALMSSDNVAAYTLAKNYPGGETAAITAMNNKASSLGMIDSKFYDPTGLYAENVSTAKDLSLLLDHAYSYTAIKEYSTTAKGKIEIPGKKKPRYLDFHTTNSLIVQDPNIMLSKTGWIRLSGGCLVMIVKHQGQRLAVILLK